MFMENRVAVLDFCANLQYFVYGLPSKGMGYVWLIVSVEFGRVSAR